MLEDEAATPASERSPIYNHADPLAALAAALGSEPRQPCGPRENSSDAEEVLNSDHAHTATPSQLPTLSLHAAYAAACAASGVDTLPAHLELLKSLPDELYVEHNCAVLPRGNAGGATIDVAALVADGAVPSPPQLAAMLRALTCRLGSGKVLLVDHLKLSGLRLPEGALAELTAAAAELGPWWRLRSLELSDCGLTLPDLDALGSLSTSSAVEHLQRLDLSRNPGIGRGAGGQLHDSAELMGSGRLLLMHLWRGAPLHFVDLTHTDLSSAAVAALLRMLRTYVLPSAAPGCASYLHDGARPALQCLRVGPPPGEGAAFSLDTVQELCSLAAAAPQLAVIEVRGLSAEHRTAVEAAWAEVQRGRGLVWCAAEVQPGLVRLAAGTAVQQRLPAESPPIGHTLPGPDTPPQRADPPTPLHLDDWVSELAHQPAPAQQSHPNSAGAAGRDADDRARAVPQVHVLTGMLPPRRPLEASRQRGQGRSTNASGSFGGDGAGRGADLHAYYDGAGVPPQRRRPPSDTSRAAGRQHAVRIYRGGAAEQLPDHGIDLGAGEEMRSEEEEEESEESYDSGPETGGKDNGSGAARPSRSGDQSAGAILPGGDAAGGGANPASAAHEERFRLRDGRIDEDSKMGRHFQSSARTLCKEIPHAEDREAALRAYRNWNRGINAWDRRRWVNPSRDQHDSPSQLNALNLLLDMFKKYGKRFDFPFPAYVPGAGGKAFEDPDAVRPQVSLAGTRSGRAAVSAAVPPAARAPVRRPSKFLEDGGRGRGSDGEEEEDAEMDGFLRPDGDDGSSGSEGDAGMDVADANDSQDDVTAGAVVGQRRRRAVVASSSEDEGVVEEGGGAGQGGSAVDAKAAKASARQARLLAQLLPWDWDKHVAEHPPNQAVYGQVQGKRQRRQILSPSQVDASMGSQVEEEARGHGGNAQPASKAQRGGASPLVLTAPAAPAGYSSSDDGDDDEPLVRLRGGANEPAAPAEITPAADAAAMQDGGEAEQQEQAPGSEDASPPSAAALSPAELAASAAQQLLGNLYVSPAHLSGPPRISPPPAAPAAAHPGSVAAGPAGGEDAAAAWAVVPASQDEG